VAGHVRLNTGPLADRVSGWEDCRARVLGSASGSLLVAGVRAAVSLGVCADGVRTWAGGLLRAGRARCDVHVPVHRVRADSRRPRQRHEHRDRCDRRLGGSIGAAAGGVGGTASATVRVSPGATLDIEVGGGGQSGSQGGAGGVNGGGAGGVGVAGTGGGGGGASDVRTVSCGASCPGDGRSLASRLVIAGGGRRLLLLRRARGR
jgi:Glycine rich protein